MYAICDTFRECVDQNTFIKKEKKIWAEWRTSSWLGFTLTYWNISMRKLDDVNRWRVDNNSGPSGSSSKTLNDFWLFQCFYLVPSLELNVIMSKDIRNHEGKAEVFHKATKKLNLIKTEFKRIKV